MDHWLSLLGLTFKTGLRVDDFVITSVLNGLISESKLPAAILFLDRILEFVKRSPNTVMYNILLKAAYEAKDYIFAAQIFENMLCQPDKITYTIMISLMLEKKMFQEAVSMLNRCLCDVNVTADSALFGSVMKRLLESNCFKDAEMIIPLMVHQDTYFKAKVVNVVVDYYAQRGMIKACGSCDIFYGEKKHCT
ncbi:putative pentatricopeptide repeat-containing protein [Tanacetum coccineum]